jgi:hypothetical protein
MYWTTNNFDCAKLEYASYEVRPTVGLGRKRLDVQAEASYIVTQKGVGRSGSLCFGQVLPLPEQGRHSPLAPVSSIVKFGPRFSCSHASERLRGLFVDIVKSQNLSFYEVLTSSRPPLEKEFAVLFKKRFGGIPERDPIVKYEAKLSGQKKYVYVKAAISHAGVGFLKTQPVEENDGLLEEYHTLIDKEFDNQLSDADRLRMAEVDSILAAADEWEARQLSTRNRELDNTKEMQELRQLNAQVRAILEAMQSVGNNKKGTDPPSF